MVQRVAYPFLIPGPSTVKAGPWLIALNGGDFSEAGDYLPDWDMASTIQICRNFSVDWDMVSEDIGLTQFELTLAVQIGTGPSTLPRLVLNTEILQLTRATPATVVNFKISGRQLSSVLDLASGLSLANSTGHAGPLSPRQKGLRLWRDHFRIRLEGEEPRFPIEITDLAALLGNSMGNDAPWYLDWSPIDWGRDFHGALRLYLNEQHAEFVERVINEDRQTLQIIMADVMNQVCERLVTEDNAPEIIRDAEPGTLGAQAANWLGATWPGSDVGLVRSILEHRPGKFRAAFLSLAAPRD